MDPDPLPETVFRKLFSRNIWFLTVALAAGTAGLAYCAVPAVDGAAVSVLSTANLPGWTLWLGAVLGLSGSVRFTLLDNTIFSLDRGELLSLAHTRPRTARRLVDQREDILRTWFTLLAGSLFFNLIFALSVYGLVLRVFSSRLALSFIPAWIVAVCCVFVLGEILPGLIASHWLKRLAPFSSRRFYFWSAILFPLTLGPMLAWHGCRRLSPTGGVEPLKRLEVEKRLLAMIGVGVVEVDLEEEQRELIDAAMEFGEKKAGDVMLPRSRMVGVEAESTQVEVLALLRETRHSRIPVYAKTFDEIVGVLHTKEVLLQPESEYHSLVHSPIFVEQDMELIELMAIMRRNPIQLVMVLDEYGSTVGMVSMNDVLEALVGEASGAEVVE